MALKDFGDFGHDIVSFCNCCNSEINYLSNEVIQFLVYGINDGHWTLISQSNISVLK